MEWNTKWDWESIDIYNNLKGVTSPKKIQSAYWGIGEGEDIDGSFNLSRVDGGAGSSTKSSISASAESSFEEGMNMKRPDFAFEGFGCPPDSYSKKKEFGRGGEVNKTSPLVSSGEPFIGLKLGKRTYFENNGYAKSSIKASSLLGIPVASVSAGKKAKSSCQITPVSRCQVEGCNLDLSSAKEYHRKHRVCETHSKCPKVIVAGLECRFCQQCSRFHSMSEFDEEKRSCRRRLSDHNARRRKPQQESIRFSSMGPCSSFYGVQLSEALNMPTFALNRLVPSKSVRAEIFDQGLKESSSNVDALDLRRALSLLSNNSWEPNSMAPIHSSGPTVPQQAVPPHLPLEYWQAEAGQPPINLAAKSSNATNTFQELQIFKTPYENSSPFMFHPTNG